MYMKVPRNGVERISMAQKTSGQSKDCQSCPVGGFKTMCGGQALIEGIMMRGPKSRPLWCAALTVSLKFRRRH